MIVLLVPWCHGFLVWGRHFVKGEGAMGRCLLSSFLLFSMSYVRCLMMFWCMHFIMLLMLFFGDVDVFELWHLVLMDNTSNFCNNG